MVDAGSVTVKMNLDTSQFTSGLAAAKAQATGIGASIESALAGHTGSMGKIGQSLSAGFNDAAQSALGSLGPVGTAIGALVGPIGATTAAIGGIALAAGVAGAAVTKMAADQERAFMKVAKIMDLDKKQLDQYKVGARDLSNTYGKSTNEIAGISANLAATGRYKPGQDLLNATEIVTRASTAFEMDPTETATGLSQIAQAYDLDTEAVSRYGSAVAQLADDSGATENQIIRGGLAMAGLRKEFGLSIDQVNGLTAAFAEVGIQPEETATQFRSMFSIFTSGSKQSVAAMKELGITEEDYNRAVREGKLPELFATVASRLKGVTSEMKRANLAADLFGSYGRNMANMLPGTIGRYQELTKVSRDAYESNTRLTEESDRSMSTLYNQIDRLKNILGNFGASIGDNLLKPLTEGLTQVNNFLQKTFAGDVRGAFEGLTESLLSYDWLGAGRSIATKIFNGLMFLSTFGLEAVAGIANAFKNHDWAGTANYIVNMLKGGLQAGLDFASWIKSSLSAANIGAVIGSVFNSIQNLASYGANIATQIGQGIQSGLSSFSSWISSGIDSAKSAIVSKASEISSWLTSAFSSGGLSGVASAIGKALLDAITSAINYVKGAIGGLVSDFWSGFASALTGSASSAKWDISGAMKNVIGGGTGSAAAAGGATASGAGNTSLTPSAVTVNPTTGEVAIDTSKYDVLTPTTGKIKFSQAVAELVKKTGRAPTSGELGQIERQTGYAADPGEVYRMVQAAQAGGTTAATTGGAAPNPWAGAAGGAAATPTGYQYPSASEVRSAWAQGNDMEPLPNLKKTDNALLETTAEFSDLCGLMSEFGYLQENNAGLFYESYIGPIRDAGGAVQQISPTITGAANQAKGITVGAANTAKTTTVGASQQSAKTTVNASSLFYDKVDFSGSVWEGAAFTGGQSITNASDYMNADVRECFDMWGEGIDNSVNDWCSGVDSSSAQLGASGSKYLEGGKFIDASTVKMGDNLRYDAEEKEKHANRMDAFDKSLTEHMEGSFAGLGDVLGLTLGSKPASTFSMGSGLSGGALGSYANVIGGFTGVNPSQLTNNQAIQDAVNAYVHSVWGPSQQAARTWGVAGSGADWVGTGSTAAWNGGQGTGGVGSMASELASQGWHGSIGSLQFASGGIVTKPLMGMIGEKGEKEAVIPLSQFGNVARSAGFVPQSEMRGTGIFADTTTSAGNNVVVHTVVNIDGRKAADAIGPAMVERLRAGAGLKVR